MPNLQAAQVLIPAAVEASLHYMRQLRVEREHQLRPLLQQDVLIQPFGKRAIKPLGMMAYDAR